MSAFFESNLRHKEAVYALRCVDDVVNNHPDLKSKYRSEARQVSDRIYSAGLVQTLTFYCSKMDWEKDDHFQLIFSHLVGWVLSNHGISRPATPHMAPPDAVKILADNFIMINDPSVLILYTERAKALGVWLSRFASAKIEKENKK
ncbi:MAG: type III-B CRISPR module-associated protein Cmr5 [Archaeoglobales archaeon]|nr:type III-B CRISPR module-associated protein Cmr5 [Archaeoglobales archaeon]